MKPEYKCGFCNKTYSEPGHCQHGSAKVELKKVNQVGSSYAGDLGRKQPGKSFNQS